MKAIAIFAVSFLFCSIFGAAHAGGVYRCIDASGRTTYQRTPCAGGEDTGIQSHGNKGSGIGGLRQSELDMLNQSIAERNARPDRTRKSQHAFASPHMLDTICGRHFDGINATNIENLERSLRNRQNSSFDHAAEMSELKCRLRHLYEAKYGTAPEHVVEQELQHKHPKQMENEVPSGGAIDRYGNFYPRSGNGVINPKTGEYYPRTGNGYFNPRTGEFMPAM